MTDKEVERLIKKKAEEYSAYTPDSAHMPDAEKLSDTEDVPELLYFSSIIKDTKSRIKRQQNIQFAIFIVIAVMIAAPMMLCLFASAAVFAAAQIIPIVLLIILRLHANHTEATR